MNTVQFPGQAQRPEVEILDDRPVTTSIKVAEFFGKQHQHVMRDIRNTLAAAGESTELNFQPSVYRDATGRVRPMYLMDKDAFTVLAMRYTGEDLAGEKS